MKPDDAIRELGARFQIETSHVDHVASLALKLFDGFGFNPADRPLLDAAARLHDIGYASDPENHVDAGLKILEENPLPAFSTKEWKLVCLIVSLHRRDWRPVLTEEVKATFSKKRLGRAKALAAALRIADGLDHSHIQDVSIRFCRRGKKVDKIGVKVRWYEPAVVWAEGKSDLWETVFKRSFRIEADICSSKDLFKGVVKKEDTALTAARRIFHSQYDMMRDQVPGILEGGDSERLHDYRVALRRLHTALRLFHPLLRGTSARELRERLGDLSTRMGPLRDAHVLFEFFKKLDAGGCGNPEIFQKLAKQAADADRQVADVLRSELCAETTGQLCRFLRVELPDLERGTEEIPGFAGYIGKRIEQLKRRLAQAELSDRMDAMHEVRKLCRRARYVAEFGAPVLGGETRRLARRLKEASARLGDFRDIHLHINTLGAEGFEPMEKLEALRAEAGAEFSRAWETLCRRLKQAGGHPK